MFQWYLGQFWGHLGAQNRPQSGTATDWYFEKSKKTGRRKANEKKKENQRKLLEKVPPPRPENRGVPTFPGPGVLLRSIIPVGTLCNSKRPRRFPSPGMNEMWQFPERKTIIFESLLDFAPV